MAWSLERRPSKHCKLTSAVCKHKTKTSHSISGWLEKDQKNILIQCRRPFWNWDRNPHLHVWLTSQLDILPTCWLICCCDRRPAPPASSCSHSTQASSQAKGTLMCKEDCSQAWVAFTTAWISGAILFLCVFDLGPFLLFSPPLSAIK